ncbi:MAG: YicC family protein [Planctomycetes bacterium]|nr:YicC family protein [Planctomycetota bacterium]
MTGFGAAALEQDGARFSVEVRSVNNRFFKSAMRLPGEFESLEADIEALIMRRLTRGSVTVTVRWTETSARTTARINVAALESYASQLRAAGAAGLTTEIRASDLLALPGVIVDDRAERLAESARPVLMKLVNEACDALLAMREREGDALRALLSDFGVQIQARLDAVRERAPQVVAGYQERLLGRLQQALKDLGASVSEADVVREVAIFAERSDIAEEIARLGGHVDQFRAIIDPANPQPAGRALDFLAQEMLREANTIASKSGDVEISRRVVEIKTAIDRIKEQAQNAE